MRFPDGASVGIVGALAYDVAATHTKPTEVATEGWTVDAPAGTAITISIDEDAPIALYSTSPGGAFSGAPFTIGTRALTFNAPAHTTLLIAVQPVVNRYTMLASCAGSACAPLSFDGAPCPNGFVDDIVACAANALAANAALTGADAVVACSDAAPVAVSYDAHCAAAGPQPVYCDADFGTFWIGIVGGPDGPDGCINDAQRAFAEPTCVLGFSVDDLKRSDRLLLSGETLMQQGAVLSAAVDAELVAAVADVDASVQTSTDAFLRVERGFIAKDDVIDRFLGVAVTVVSFSIDNVVGGLAFRAGTNDVVARITAGRFTDCALAPGKSGAACNDDTGCAPLTCAGLADGSPEGRCADVGAQAGGGAPCSGDVADACGDALFCAGLTTQVSGVCTSPDATASVGEAPYLAVPDATNGASNEGLARSLDVRGLAQNVVDVELRAVVRHPSLAQLAVTLTDPDGDVVNAFVGADASDGVDLFLDAPLRFPAAAHANGPWTIHVVDEASGQVGYLERWDLFLSSH